MCALPITGVKEEAEPSELSTLKANDTVPVSVIVLFHVQGLQIELVSYPHSNCCTIVHVHVLTFHHCDDDTLYYLVLHRDPLLI